MKKKFRNFLGLIILVCGVLGGVAEANAATPSGWTVNPHDFRYDMSIWMDCKLDGSSLDYSRFVVAAFIGNECRGVGEVINLNDESKILMRVYNDKPSGEITFKAYSESTGIVNSFQSLDFVSDGTQGMPSKPYIVNFTEQDFLMGDVNNDKTVNITDVVTTVNKILGNQVSVWNEAAADVNKDGTVNITDVVGIVSIILNSN